MATNLPPREGLFISVSQLKQYHRCGRSYELKYVRGEQPAWVPLPLAFGSAFHAALGLYYGHIKLFGAPASLEEMQDGFRDAWEKFVTGALPIHTGPDEEDGALDEQVDKAMHMIAAFRSYAITQPVPKVHAVEQKFTIELHDPETGELLDELLTGFMDIVLGPDEGRYSVVENKSAARRYDLNTLRWDYQLTAYSMAARALGLGDPHLVFQVVTKAKKPAVQVEPVRRDDSDEDDLMRLTVATLRAIDAGAFAPIRSWACSSCPFQHACNGRR